MSFIKGGDAKNNRRRGWRLFSILPVLIPFLLVFGAGLFITLMQSLGLLLPVPGEELSIRNYLEVFQSPWFSSSFRFTFFTALLSSSGAVFAGTIAGYIHYRLSPVLPRTSGVYAVPLFLPHISAAFVILLLWGRTGIISSVFFRLGIISDYSGFPDFIYRHNGAAVIFAYLFKETPFVMLMILGLLRNFRREEIQTARMLGGREPVIFVRLVLPFLVPMINTLFTFLFVFNFGAFDIPFILGTSRPAMLSVKAFNLYFMRDLTIRPQASALLMIIFIFSLISVFLYFTLMKRLRLKSGSRL